MPNFLLTLSRVHTSCSHERGIPWVVFFCDTVFRKLPLGIRMSYVHVFLSVCVHETSSHVIFTRDGVCQECFFFTFFLEFCRGLTFWNSLLQAIIIMIVSLTHYNPAELPHKHAWKIFMHIVFVTRFWIYNNEGWETKGVVPHVETENEEHFCIVWIE